MSDRWRVGRSLGRTIYCQIGDGPSKSDQYVGVANSRTVAALVVSALNGDRPNPATAALAFGRLVYLSPAPLNLKCNVVMDFDLAMDTAYLAQRVAEALGGPAL